MTHPALANLAGWAILGILLSDLEWHILLGTVFTIAMLMVNTAFADK